MSKRPELTLTKDYVEKELSKGMRKLTALYNDGRAFTAEKEHEIATQQGWNQVWIVLLSKF